MSLFNQPNLTAGIDDALITTAQSVSVFPIMILLFVWGLIFIGGSSNQKKRLGVADYPFWNILAFVSVTFVSLIFSLGEGMINLTTLGIIIALTILSAIWFFLSKVRGEQD